MRWRAGIAILALVVLTCGALLLRRWTASGGRSATPVLSLRVNNSRRTAIIPGTPLVFDVSLTGGADGSSAAIGDARRPWPTLIRFVRAGSDDTLPWQVALLGHPISITRGSDAGSDPAFHAEAVAAAALGPDHLSRAAFAVPPDAMHGAQPGTYQIQAVVERAFWPPWRRHGRAVSAPVTVVIESNARASDRDRRSQERLILSARYYLASHQPDSAHRAAAELTARDPKDAESLTLLGDALLAEGKPRDALRAYRSALAVLPARYEAPLLLYRRIEDASRKLVK